MAQRIVIVRHGETEWSKTGRHTGRTDLALLEEGRTAATGLAARLAPFRFEAVLVSPLKRARDTCALAGFGPPAEVDPDLSEWDYGDYEGRTTAEILVELPGWSIWNDPVPGGEAIDDVADRADQVIARARAVPGDVLLIAHGHLLRILAARWVGADPRFGSHLMLGPASVSVLGYERDTPGLISWNC